MNVPFYGLDRQWRQHRETMLAIIDRVLSTGQVLQGPAVETFELDVAKATRRRYGVAVGSCTDALAFALAASGLGDGDEVLMPCFSFVASVAPLVRLGARPRFVDIDAETFMMDLDALESSIGPQTKAILAIGLFGQTPDMARHEAIADRHGLVLIEDAAQSLGSSDRARPGGSLGRASCFSFDPTKVVASFSSGGMVVTDDATLAERVRRLRYHGRDAQTREYAVLGYNSQLSTEMAALLSYKLKHLPAWTTERDRVATVYQAGLGNIGEVVLPRVRPGSTHTWHKFVIRAENRDGLASWLKERGIGTMIHYPKLLPDTPYLASHNSAAHDLPVGRKIAGEVLSLPIYPEITNEEADYVVDTIKSFYDSNLGGGR